MRIIIESGANGTVSPEIVRQSAQPIEAEDAGGAPAALLAEIAAYAAGASSNGGTDGLDGGPPSDSLLAAVSSGTALPSDDGAEDAGGPPAL